MRRFAFGTLAVFAVSTLWLIVAWYNGYRTWSWRPTTARIVRVDTQKSISGRAMGWLTTISYTINGTQYDAVVDEYLIGKEATVFVNPDDPTKVAGKAGARFPDLGPPLITTIGSGLFAVALLLVAFSPKDD